MTFVCGHAVPGFQNTCIWIYRLPVNHMFTGVTELDFQQWQSSIESGIDTGAPESIRAAFLILARERPDDRPRDFHRIRKLLLQKLRDRIRELPSTKRAEIRALIGYTLNLPLAAPQAKPSKLIGAPDGPITDAEQIGILNSIKTEDGIRQLGAGKKSAGTDPIIVISGAYSLRASQVARLYRPGFHGTREWSAAKMEWQRALMEDTHLVLAATRARLSGVERNRVMRSLEPYMRHSGSRTIESRARSTSDRLVKQGLLVQQGTHAWAIAEEHRRRFGGELVASWMTQTYETSQDSTSDN